MNIHIPVLTSQILKAFDIKSNNIIVDCTFGQGGHFESFVNHIDYTGLIIGIDKDPLMISQGEKKYKKFIDDGYLLLINSEFGNIDKILNALKYTKVDIIFADLGISTYQIKDMTRGFSFDSDISLDMRINPLKQGISAYDIVNDYSKDELTNIFYKFGQEPKAKFIADAIVKYRNKKKIKNSKILSQIVKNSVFYKNKSKNHPATRVFQALRIFVNDELEQLKKLLDKSPDLLRQNGKIGIISFHSLEDKMVKNKFLKLSKKDNDSKLLNKLPILEKNLPKQLRPITKIIKPFPAKASQNEILSNRNSRSARFRACKLI